MENEGAWLNRRFFCYHTQKRPYIILKWAQTPEGYFAPLDKQRRQITNEQSRQLLHKWRTEEAAIMTGFTTALNDDPELTARLWEGKQPLRIVLDKSLALPGSHKLFNSAADTWIINQLKTGNDGSKYHIQLPFDEHLLQALMELLYDKGILSIIIEGGAVLLNAFININLWDEARIFTGETHLADGISAPELTNCQPAFSTSLGNDILHIFTNRNSEYSYVPHMEL